MPDASPGSVKQSVRPAAQGTVAVKLVVAPEHDAARRVPVKVTSCGTPVWLSTWIVSGAPAKGQFGSSDDAKVGLGVGVGLFAGVTVAVAVMVGIGVGVLVLVGVAVAVAVFVGVPVGVSVGVHEGDAVAVAVLAGVCVSVMVGAGAAVDVLVTVRVGFSALASVDDLVGERGAFRPARVATPAADSSVAQHMSRPRTKRAIHRSFNWERFILRTAAHPHSSPQADYSHPFATALARKKL